MTEFTIFGGVDHRGTVSKVAPGLFTQEGRCCRMTTEHFFFKHCMAPVECVGRWKFLKGWTKVWSCERHAGGLVSARRLLEDISLVRFEAPRYPAGERGFPNGQSRVGFLQCPLAGGRLLCERWACCDLLYCALVCLGRRCIHAGGHQLHRNGHQQSGRDHRRARRRPVVHQQQATTPSGASPRRGAVANYTCPAHNRPRGITVGPDGALWFTNAGKTPVGVGFRLHRAHHDGRGRLPTTPAPAFINPEGIAAGPDGALGSRTRSRGVHRAHHDGWGRHQLHRNGHQ